MELNPTVEESLDNLAADILSTSHLRYREVVDPEWNEAGDRPVGNWMHRAWCARTRLYDQEWISPQELDYQLEQINRAISKAQDNGLINISVARLQLSQSDGYINPKFTPDDIGKFYFAVEAVEPNPKGKENFITGRIEKWVDSREKQMTAEEWDKSLKSE